VSVISHTVWQRDFAGRSDALGATVHVNGLPTRVIGVAPEPFVGVRREDYQTDVWVPIVYAAAILRPDPGKPDDGSRPRPAFVDVVGRLAPTATAGQVEERAQTAVIALFESMPETPVETAISRGRPRRPVVSVRPVMLNDPSEWPGAIAAIGFVPAIVLVVACINAGLLLVARAGRRQREWTVRLALGSSRWRIMRVVLLEALALSLLAVGPALGIAAGLLQLAQVRWPLPMPVDSSGVLFSIAASVFTAVGFGLGPAWTVARHATPVTSVLGRFTSRARARVVLVGVQAALCVALLMTGLQFVRVIDLRTQPGGVSDPDHLLVARLDLESLHYGDAQASELSVRLLAGARTVPGVEAVVVSSALYWGTHGSGDFVRVWLAGETTGSEKDDRGSGRSSPATLVDGQLFEALDLRANDSSLLSDRDANRWDGVVVNRAFEEHVLKGPALGRRIRLGASPPATGPEVEAQIVGVVDNASGPRIDGKPHLYYTARTSPGETDNVKYLYLRVSEGAQVGQALRALVASLDDRIAVEVSSLREVLMANRQDERWFAQALQILGGLGLALAAVGLFGIVAYVVAERTPEIGLRMALGAPAGRVVVMIWRQAMTPVLVGLVVGSIAAVGTGLVVRSRLYGTQPVDLVALGMTSVFMLIVMSLASFIPSRRATRIDPRITLGDV
jgi:predicted permease